MAKDGYSSTTLKKSYGSNANVKETRCDGKKKGGKKMGKKSY